MTHTVPNHYPFDRDAPGAQRLLRTIQRIRTDHQPVPVEVLAPILILDPEDGRGLAPGDHAFLPRRSIKRLLDQRTVRLL
jgi:hypothetical protein